MIEFTYEIETHISLPFIDIILNHIDNDLNLIGERISSKRNELLNFYSPHNIKIKSGMII